MSTGQINVTAENIFPIIKKFLYSDHEIFLRELVSNAVDATVKLNTLAGLGEFKGEVGEPIIEIIVDKDNKQLRIKDQGIGMTAEEVDKYINQVAFSGAEEFVNKYKDKSEQAQAIIGHFGLGFYSSFMVSDKVEIITKSYQDAPAVRWECDGSPEFTLEETDKKDRGTEIVLHIAEDSEEFLEESRIAALLNKYCKFMPVPIKLGEREETITKGEGEDATEEKIKVDNIINNPNPAWVRKPADLNDEDYKAFYRELYPMQFEEPLFHIHLNVDYPFNLTGILYFPKIQNQVALEKDKIQLYQNQVFVTDNVEGIVPDFLNLLRGVIDSPDIPLNVSRSYLQADGAVKKISGYITRKVADKMESLFKADREDYENKWEDIKIIIEYGMLTEDKFYEKSPKFYLYPTTDGNYYTREELINAIGEKQKDKDGNIVVLYAAHKDNQHSYIERANKKGYEVLLLDSPIIAHLIQKLEGGDEKLVFKRVDADSIDKLIPQENTNISKLSDEQKDSLKTSIEGNIDTQKYHVQVEDLDSDDSPMTIVVPEFIRRMKEMSMTGGGMMGMNQFPETYNLIVNSNSPLAEKILEAGDDVKSSLITNGLNLALLSQNLLKGPALTEFIQNGFEKLSNNE